ncbi:retinol dehydrogenase 11-like [Oppia nitens]|uniref:retinol dehydrogenase 11-like n=1 Tax=Oppia nitens TaxID=1686743 RepID=UPI0023DAD984|nr:retinol dehydrogenase 11-like [Oppia nitens]
MYEIKTGNRRKCDSDRRLDGQIVVITGANTGIGKVTALELSKRGAKIIIGCRDVEKATKAVNDIKTDNPDADIVVHKLDLSSLKSVRMFADEVKQCVDRLDILVNNAGVMMCPEWKTMDGFELQFGTNHLGHFLLTMHLLPLIKQASTARIITVSSSGHMMGKIHLDNINLRNGAYTSWKAYAQSKLANVLFTRELARRLGGLNSNVKTYCVHPGPVNTDLQRHRDGGPAGRLLLKCIGLTPEMGAQTSLYCALDADLDKQTGCYYANCRKVNNMISTATDDRMAELLWDMSCNLVNLEDNLKI